MWKAENELRPGTADNDINPYKNNPWANFFIGLLTKTEKTNAADCFMMIHLMDHAIKFAAPIDESYRRAKEIGVILLGDEHG